MTIGRISVVCRIGGVFNIYIYIYITFECFRKSYNTWSGQIDGAFKYLRRNNNTWNSCNEIVLQ